MLISRSQYQNGLLIANSQDTAPNSNLLGNGVKLDSFREKYEREILIMTLGYDLYKELQSNLEVLTGQTEQSVKASADQKWKELVNGVELTIDGYTEKFEGLKSDNSFIADYVYYKFMEDDLKNHSGVGFTQSNPNGGTKTNPTQKLVSVWNDMVEKIIFYDKPYMLSLYYFLDYNNVDYPKWLGSNFDYKNQYGL